MSTNQLINSSDYQIVKRKVHGMAETEPKKAKLDICQTIDSTPSSLNYQQVIKSDSIENSDTTKSDNLLGKEELDIDLKNGQLKSLTTHGKSLNNNNLNAINLNNIKTDLNKEGEVLNKSDTNNTPSHVVHLRNIPNDATEAEIINFGLSFGNTVNCLLLKGKNQAFLEFADLDSAKSMVNCLNINYQQQNSFNGKTNLAQLPTIRGRQIFVQYSNYKKLSKTNDAKVDSVNNLNKNFNYNQINNSKIILLNEDILFNKTNNLINQQANSEQGVQSYLSSSINPLNKNLNNNSLMVSKNMGGTNLQTNSRLNNGNSSSQIQPSSVLRVIVDNMMYLVPLETFHELFSRFGKVTKIVTFNKNGAFQALIQFDSNSAATSAKSAYDGQQMFTSGNLLRIEYSKLSNLSVKYNNEKSRDFTNSNLPAGPTLTANSVLSSVRNGAAAAAAAAAASAPLVGSNSLAGLNTHLNPQQLALAAAASAAQQQQHYQHLEHVFSDPLALAGISSFPGLTNSLPYASLRSTLNTQGNGAVANSLGNVLSRNDLSTVLLVSNLSEQMATPDALFTLFGVYGDVIRVKILFNKKDNALVQMSCITQAQLVITFLDKINLFGNVLKISISKYSNVQMPKEGQPDSGLTKDYTSSPLHRFKKPGSKNYQNIFPPSSTLHLSNIPSSCTEQQLREAFETIANVKVVNFKFFPNDQKMALIQLNSIEDAVSALIKMHNYQLSESNHLRVSFSKSSI